ncbi:hypothetical protein C8F04DRAFT_1085819 [Mycena alexandri]|uniref:Fungal-type protein kinase domain-containing protein n=1 Tax=Mycena alexandri TaxID=1745969 RepID=A0AAD6X7J9_9AGAR|nr:hypothetical protein C8F04DRAFT_1085819 [Mycena alexandri]
MPVTPLHDRLAQELNEAINLDVPSLVEHIFPDECLPLPVDVFLEALTGMRGSHSLFQQRALRRPDYSWVTFPKNPEAFATELAAFLNGMSQTMRDVCLLSGGSLPKARRWSGEYTTPSSLPLPGAHLTPRPTLVLFDGKPEEEAYHTVLAVGEIIFADDYDSSSSLHRLIHYASDSFFNQDDRRFQISLTFAAREVRLVLIDHSGVVASQFFDIDKEPELFVRSVAGLMFSSRSTIGFDTSIATLKNGQRQIKVGHDVYDIVVRLAISHDVRGKATVCWHARRNGVDFVIKDNWNEKNQNHIEAGILEVAKDIPGIAKLVTLETVIVDRTKDSTAPLRSILNGSDNSPPFRLHQRMVMTPFARKIAFFRSKKELISVFIDAIEAHRSLVDKNILHCDISSNNIMISDSTSSSYPTVAPTSVGQLLRRGILIDVDSALELNNIGYWVGFVGTFVFMSSAVLIHGSSTRQKPSDDLESFLWVLIYLCIRYAGPDNTARVDYVATVGSMQTFSQDQSQANTIGRHKKHVLGEKKGGVLEREILSKFSLYFEDLKPCIAELRDAYAKNKSKFTYDAMLGILRRTRDALPLTEKRLPLHDAVSYVLPAATHKRRRDEVENDESGRENAKR